MAGGKHRPQPPVPPLPSSATSSSSSHRNKSRLQSSAAPTPSNQNSSGNSKKSKLSSKNESLSTTNAKPPTPKPRPNINSSNPSPKAANPSPKPDPTLSKLPPFPFVDPPPSPAYGFHMLDRRTIVLADGSARSYFALPPDYQDFAALPPRPEFRGLGFGFGRQLPVSPEFRGPELRSELGGRADGFIRGRSQEYWNLGPEGRGGAPGQGEGPGNSMKRKFEDQEREGRDGFERQRLQLLQYGKVGGGVNAMPGTSGIHMGSEREDMRPPKYMTGERNMGGIKYSEVDQGELKKAFLHFVKLVYDNANQRRKYLADGKQGSLQCIACGRSSKEFSDMHGLIMHAYNSDNGVFMDHLGLHKALCILMGWNFRTPPDNSKAYQFLHADEAAANVDDLIMWPPLVIIHNTMTGKGRDGRMEGMGNRAMDNYIRDLGIGGGKSKSIYSREGHLGITLIKFGADQSGLKEAVRLSEYFEKDHHGRKGWARVESLMLDKVDENNPNLVKVDERTGEKKRIFFGYLATVSDIDKVDFETKKKIMFESRREYKPPK